jgi:hypothetical protein
MAHSQIARQLQNRRVVTLPARSEISAFAHHVCMEALIVWGPCGYAVHRCVGVWVSCTTTVCDMRVRLSWCICTSLTTRWYVCEPMLNGSEQHTIFSPPTKPTTSPSAFPTQNLTSAKHTTAHDGRLRDASSWCFSTHRIAHALSVTYGSGRGRCWLPIVVDRSLKVSLVVCGSDVASGYVLKAFTIYPS